MVKKINRTGITKAGNSHLLRTLLIEAAKGNVQRSEVDISQRCSVPDRMEIYRSHNLCRSWQYKNEEANIIE